MVRCARSDTARTITEASFSKSGACVTQAEKTCQLLDFSRLGSRWSRFPDLLIGRPLASLLLLIFLDRSWSAARLYGALSAKVSVHRQNFFSHGFINIHCNHSFIRHPRCR